MNDLLSAVMGQLDERAVSGIGRQVGADPGTTRDAIAVALPLLLGAMQRNASAGGGDALASALARDHAGADIGERIHAASEGRTLPDGAAILGHVFGARQQRAATGVSKVTGLEPSKSGQLMAMLAPIVMAALANLQRRQGGGAGGIEGLLGQVMGGLGGAGAGAGNSPLGGLLGAVLDRDGDGDVDFQDLARGGAGGQGGLGGLLGGILGGRN